MKALEFEFLSKSIGCSCSFKSAKHGADVYVQNEITILVKYL